jgi:hypothetical protein
VVVLLLLLLLVLDAFLFELIVVSGIEVAVDHDAATGSR